MHKNIKIIDKFYFFHMYFGEKLINSQLLKEMKNYIQAKLKNITWGGGPKMAEK